MHAFRHKTAGMLKIGKMFSQDGATPSSRLSMLDSWENWLADSMPSNERVGQLLEVSEIPSLEGFLQIFEAPIGIQMMADRVWPPERPSVY